MYGLDGHYDACFTIEAALRPSCSHGNWAERFVHRFARVSGGGMLRAGCTQFLIAPPCDCLALRAWVAFRVVAPSAVWLRIRCDIMPFTPSFAMPRSRRAVKCARFSASWRMASRIGAKLLRPRRSTARRLIGETPTTSTNSRCSTRDAQRCATRPPASPARSPKDHQCAAAGDDAGRRAE